ncbi:hypothetical protein F0U44_17725 [Nocardioides humilatus]|uniref:Uncharacterized protein n=1 Tax=Nocardioides humilatus TaxID=2607660 RepID=A0A5B1L9Z3_9ACTN|nr:hypothetical protein [Nocardioides humilatus]KAA1417018.1 hypothetical protein F0U44_17725 [Nocardioides humilatus]
MNTMIKNLVAGSLVVIALTSCSTDTAASSDPAAGPVLGPGSTYRVPQNDDIQIYFRSIAGVNDAGAELRFSNDIVEHLPNQQFIVNGQEPITLSRGIVVGRVTGVLPGRAYVTDSTDSQDGRSMLVGFKDPLAEWRIARLQVSVDRWYADAPAPTDIEVGAFVAHPAGDPLGQAEMRGLADLGRIVLVLDPARRFEWNTNVFPVARGGVLLGDIDTAGEIGFPGLGPESSDFVGSATIADLDAAWKATPQPIEIAIDMETGVLERK